MYKNAILIIVFGIIVLTGCQKQDDSNRFYFEGIKAEQNMQYEAAIASYAKALTYNRQDATAWYAKGRTHLLMAMTDYFMQDPGDETTNHIKGNLSKAQDCFRRAQQWGYTASIEVDTLQVKLQELLN